MSYQLERARAILANTKNVSAVFSPSAMYFFGFVSSVFLNIVYIRSSELSRRHCPVLFLIFIHNNNRS